MRDMSYPVIMYSSEPFELTPEEKLQELELMTRFFNLLNSERSRYELEAKEFMAREALATETHNYVLKYSIQRDRYICRGKPKILGSQSFSTEIPIPVTEEEKIEALVELFAQSEAG